MKFLKKASLATAIAAASISAQAGMVALDDETMAATTGQAGVTIEIDIGTAGITVGEIEYIDEGSVLVQDLKISNVKDLTQTIDVDANGNLLLGVTGVNGAQVSLGGTDGSKSAVALKAASGEVTELVNNLDMTFNLGPTNTTIVNLAKAGNAAAHLSSSAIAAGAAEGSVAITARTAIQITAMNVGAFGYTSAQADTQTTTLGAGVSASNAGAVAKVNEIITAYNAKTGSTVAAATGGTALSADQAAAVKTGIATGSAIQIEGLQFYKLNGSAKEAATIEQTIWAKGGSSATGGGVYIQLGQIAGTLEVGAIKMGGESIGALKVSDINLAGMTQRIYGH